MAPELACVTYAGAAGTGILHHTDAKPALAAWLSSDEKLVGQFVAYDTAVAIAAFPDLAPAIFRAYDEDRITDTKLRAQLLDIAKGRFRGHLGKDGTWVKTDYKLESLARRTNGRVLVKDEWRYRFGSLIPLPLAQWPEEATKYATDDAIATLEVYAKQATDPLAALALKDEYRQARASFALHLSSTWGLRTYGPGVAKLEAATRSALVEIRGRLVAAGLVRENGKRNTKAAMAHMVAVCAEEGLALRLTSGGKSGIKKPCLDADACEATGDPLLKDYADFTGYAKTLNADVEMLSKGTQHPIHPRYDIAASGRTTCSKPNIQNLRKFPGIRECFVPRAGKVFIQGDLPQLELYTLAQCCYAWLGYSTLGEMLKKGIDPHTSFAAKIGGISYEEGVKLNKAKDHRFSKELRQIAKVFNFGKPGGLGPKKLVTLGASDAYKVTITEKQAKEYGAEWLKVFPEMKEYFARVNFLVSNTAKLATVTLPCTGFTRGGAMYCAACNTGFQGLGAACAKNGMYLVARAEYAEPASPLYGARTVAMVHDELIAEADEATCHESAHELVRLMVVGANAFLPDVPIALEKMEPTVMRVWSKDAKQVWKNGRLVPWEMAA